MWLHACCGLLCSAYPQHFAHGSVNKIPGYVTEILVKTTGTVQMLGRAPQQNAQAQPKPQQNGQPQSADATKKGGAKTKGRGRKAAQPEPQPQQQPEPPYGFDDDAPF